ncbi:universal stress protein [Natrarchaeobius oligotrophus]|uniref:universal stress protein n=1 Tax=Natrarchaeobius oligotrophus TaxID=3455743 RepID=UPI001FB52BB3|nr:universal stress protein [Natrarchaeobius chitinivorans]
MTLDTLLIPTDGSDPAENAARRGFDLASSLDANVHVLSVADSSVATGAGYSGDSPSIRNRLRERAEVRAASLRDDAIERGLDATAAVRDGIPADEIVDYADERTIDAIVVGTSGRGGVARAIVGSVADKVVRTASVPVVTITSSAADRAERATGIDSILLPTDGSEAATEALERGRSLAAQLEATVHLLSVVDDDLANALGDASGDDVGSETDRRASAQSHLEGIAADVRSRGLEAVTATTKGRPSEEIVEYADENGVDVIAMGTHGRGGFERLLVGSVTDRVIRTASVPVFTVRPNAANAEDSGTRAETEPTQLAFVCVQNAGRSQMAYAFARRELEARNLADDVDLVTGGTDPADRIHPVVVESMRAVGIDVSDRSPREVTVDERRRSDYVVTMGCSDADACPAGWPGESRDWEIADPDGRSPEEVAEIRDEIERRVNDLLDELSRDA